MDLADFTVCVRINLNMLRGREQFFLSYVNAEFDEALTGAIIQDVGNKVCPFEQKKKKIIIEREKNEISFLSETIKYFYSTTFA